jgi:hypothetical protein
MSVKLWSVTSRRLARDQGGWTEVGPHRQPPVLRLAVHAAVLPTEAAVLASPDWTRATKREDDTRELASCGNPCRVDDRHCTRATPAGLANTHQFETLVWVVLQYFQAKKFALDAEVRDAYFEAKPDIPSRALLEKVPGSWKGQENCCLSNCFPHVAETRCCCYQCNGGTAASTWSAPRQRRRGAAVPLHPHACRAARRARQDGLPRRAYGAPAVSSGPKTAGGAVNNRRRLSCQHEKVIFGFDIMMKHERICF